MTPRTTSVIASLCLVASVTAQDGVNDATEAALKAAAQAAAPWVAKIETSGGREVVGSGGGPGAVRKGVGPTTGVVVAPDGYVVSSAFNFANKPTDVYVTVPGRPRAVAKVVAHDTSRMLTLLKVDLSDLPVPTAVPKAEIRVGQWALALGRTLDPDAAGPPSVSAGIVSAVGRIWGRALQTDAKVSPVNYGGPLVAVDGRALGVVIPASPESDADAAGVEWYDSGIGFAVPMEDVFAVLPRLKQGKDIRRGLLGISVTKPDDQYLDPVVVSAVSPGSAADKAGVKPGDKLVSLDGKPVANYAQMAFALGPKYEGDSVAVVVRRGDADADLGTLTLSGAVTAFVRPFLGILPVRDDAEPGVEIRYVYPDSPAAAAKLVAGDRILQIGPASADELAEVANRNQLAAVLTRIAAGAEVKLEVKRRSGKTETVTARLTTPPDAVSEKPDAASTKKQALARAKKKADAKDKEEPETGLLKRTTEATGREYWVYVPESYDKNVSYGVLVWLHAAGKGGKDAEDVVDIWKDFCADQHFLLVGPKSKNPEGWRASETEEVVQAVKDVLAGYTTDRTRVVTHGMGVGGQMAFYLGFAARDVVRGVAVSGAALGTQPKDAVPTQPLAFYVVAGDKDPLVKEIAEGVDKLKDKRYPVIYRQLAEFGKEYLDTKTLDELKRWMDSLDRM
jgi:serine protease Do